MNGSFLPFSPTTLEVPFAKKMFAWDRRQIWLTTLSAVSPDQSSSLPSRENATLLELKHFAGRIRLPFSIKAQPYLAVILRMTWMIQFVNLNIILHLPLVPDRLQAVPMAMKRTVLEIVLLWASKTLHVHIIIAVDVRQFINKDVQITQNTFSKQLIQCLQYTCLKVIKKKQSPPAN